MLNRRTRTAVIVSAVAVLMVAIAIVSTLARSGRRAVMTQPQDLSQITLIDSRTGWALTKNGQILRTVNGGATWADVSIFQAPLPVQAPPTTDPCFLDAVS